MRYTNDMQKKALILIIFALMALAGDELSVRISEPPLGTQEARSLVTIPAPVKYSEGFATAIRTIDGDTIVIDINGTQEKVRLIGVDTPEAVDPRKPVQCFGKEASVFTKNLLEGKRVRLEADPSQGDRDKYGRLLRYVFLSDDTFVNKEIIAQGYGHEYTYRAPYQHQTDFKTAERFAREQQKGLWAPGVCG